MMRMMMKMSPWLLLLGLAVTHTVVAGPGSCVGRCGEVYTRGQPCTCDFSCLQHNECCPDFQAACITGIGQSCQGRCGETFLRGRLCDCDPRCVLYNTCCPDYQLRCDDRVLVSQTRTFQTLRAAASGKRKSDRRWRSSSEEWYTVRAPCPGPQCPAVLGLKPLTATFSGPAPPVVPTNPLQHGVSHILDGGLPVSIHSSHGGAPDSPAHGSSLPSSSALSLGSIVPVRSSGPGAADGNVHLVLSPEGGSPSGPSLGLLANVDLCSDSPINGLTALSNGTILIFKGELFWSVDPTSRSVGRPRSITDTLGVPSPIDTVFTRCNCLGHTYIIKGDQYWRLDGNMVMEPGFPKLLTSEFPGLKGSISAALAVPPAGGRPETVYFFGNGDIMQTFTFPPGSTPLCSVQPRSSVTRRLARQAVLLSAAINIKVSLKGFPTPITSALSIPSLQRSDPYQHYVFSGPLFFRVQISGDLPVLAKPDPSEALLPLPILSPATVAVATNMAGQNAKPPPPANSIRVWLRCP